MRTLKLVRICFDSCVGLAVLAILALIAVELRPFRGGHLLNLLFKGLLQSEESGLEHKFDVDIEVVQENLFLLLAVDLDLIRVVRVLEADLAGPVVFELISLHFD